nr:isochorismatase family protein [Oceanococcus sp. HetDA_MAG_MS8]
MDSFTSPDWRHSAVLCIDMQRDFVCPTGACPVPGTAQVVPAIASLLQHARLATK